MVVYAPASTERVVGISTLGMHSSALSKSAPLCLYEKQFEREERGLRLNEEPVR